MCRVSLIALVLLAACAHAPPTPPVVVPQIVRVPVPTPVALPPALTVACRQEDARSQSYEEALRLLELRRIWLADCASRMDRVRKMQPAVKP